MIDSELTASILEAQAEADEVADNYEKNENLSNEDVILTVPKLLSLPKDAAIEKANEIKSKGSQLDLLLIKAESYSHFILENQKNSQLAAGIHDDEDDEGNDDDKIKDKKRVKNQSTKSPGKKSKSNVTKFQQPKSLVGGTLMSYQLEGLRWLLTLYENGLSGILADEMGLGKTIQIISLVAELRQNGVNGPFLIAGPLATLMNWINEFHKWLPSCPVLLYHGSKQERAELRKKHMSLSNTKSVSFPIIITSFEICLLDRIHLERYLWQYIILDEGHRIKNRNCKLVKELKQIKSVSRLLLTGTPIQNTLEELWSLLNFCSPTIFDDLDVFQSWFGFRNIGKDTQVDDIISTEQQERIVTKLHEILRPFLLRRMKKDVLIEMPPKKEIVIYCGLSPLQKVYYSLVMNGTLRESLLTMNIENANMISQQNTTMNLRKVCNHPFLFGEPKVSKKDYIKGTKLHTQFTDKVNTVTTNSPIKNNKRATKAQVYVDLDSDCEDLFRSDTPPITSKSSTLSRVESTISLSNATDYMDYIGVVDPQTLINGSGKVKLLDRMLPLLKRGNHKVLIFSQMTELLNIIQDYCYYKKYNMVRLDGSTKLTERQAAIDSYNNPNDDVFIFLLSTRAGGLGINLTAADTVFIFDSDWNPHQDSQAQDRCHRIGQKKPVIVYRLLTHNSIEIEMMERQLSKKKLEKLTIHGGDYRKAGERWGKEMTISTLRRLLSDEVNVSRMSTHNSSNNLEDGADIDISDAELASIMNRQLLFPSDDNCSIPLEGDCYDIVDNKVESSILQALN